MPYFYNNDCNTDVLSLFFEKVFDKRDRGVIRQEKERRSVAMRQILDPFFIPIKEDLLTDQTLFL
jgi:hypothetical protein